MGKIIQDGNGGWDQVRPYGNDTKNACPDVL